MGPDEDHSRGLPPRVTPGSAPDPDPPPLEELAAQFIRAAERWLVVPDANVSRSEARALFELVAARGIAQGELAALLGLEKSTVSRLAAGLERKGWVSRGRDTGNQRYVRLQVTAEGRSVAARVWHGWHDRQARVLGELTAEERAGLALGLRGLVRALCAGGPAEAAAGAAAETIRTDPAGVTERNRSAAH